ncbi:hypothetical protein ASPWEDRAFT_166918 [Aspergillus wentii DTO 134E9]|uniref:Major facilitator superfamily (MFS) profile domain-containing protein n=1 Tax=Aspergillus wentii DTO 134E9 TaxID=1073089 RepID=A0A1L9S140_ASPWE|nr:uncharacterized protein ASPWEDRAFT_166918 [Aspergillus wentii DTO 134E9]OJJ40864.1 hypothetical protein ASPWEDRAFT_166918 [Aspergillus wentii DTO 134E9]
MTAIDGPDEESPLLQPRAAQSQKGARSNLFIIYATFFGVFIASVDESLVISTYSTIASQFHLLSQGSWLLVAYNFGYCISLPVYGALSVSYGRKNVLVMAYILFTFGCFACGASASLAQLVLARVLAGVSGAGMVSLVSIIIMDLVPSNEVTIYRSYENTINVIGRSVGAPLGGLLSDTIGWRWSFFGQMPLIMFCTLVAVYGLPASLNESDQKPSQKTSRRSRLKELDFAGIVTLAVAIICLLFILQTAGTKEDDMIVPTWALGIAFTIALTVFVLTEVFWASKPLIPMHLLVREFGAYCMMQILLFSGRSALISNVVPYFTRVQGTSDFFSAIMYVQVAVGVTIGGVISGFIIKRTRRYKTMSVISICILILAYLFIFLIWRNGCNVWESLLLFGVGFAPGILFSTMFIGMSYSAPKESLSVCISVYFLFQQLGMIIGPAVGAALLQGVFKDNLVQRIGEIADNKMIIKNVLNNLRFAESLPEPLQEIVRSSYLNAFQFLPVLGLVCCGPILPWLVYLKEERVD